MILLTLLLSIWLPPEFPELPSGYSKWVSYDSPYSIPEAPYFRKGFASKEIEEDSSLTPYYFLAVEPLGESRGYGDSTFGVVMHYSSSKKSGFPHNYVEIEWSAYHESDSLDPRPLYSYGGYISYDTLGFEKIVINGMDAWRIRGKWWRVTCDGGIQISGSFTNYYIPTEKLDFRITCLSRFYLYDTLGPDPLGFEHYPDRIAELERAVEQTFRVK